MPAPLRAAAVRRSAVTGVSATAQAVRGRRRMKAISPTTVPGPARRSRIFSPPGPSMTMAIQPDVCATAC